MGRIMTYNDVADVNEYLKSKGLNYKVHMHDLCGSQSFTIKPVDNTENIGTVAAKTETCTYFNQKGMELIFAENNLDFVIM